MKINFNPPRYTLINAFALLFLVISSIIRLVFLFLDFEEVDTSIIGILKIFFTGLFFDIGTISFFYVTSLLYFLLLPKRWYGSILDRVITYFGLFVGLLIIYFSFFAEITFWDEFQRRFNFIAVDYLIYTYEVVKNINESYPLPLLIGAILLLVIATVMFFLKKGVLKKTFTSGDTFRQKLIPSIGAILIMLFFTFYVENEFAETSKNRFNNELSKAGIYSFFAAFRNNELSYKEFYATIPEEDALGNVQKQLCKADDSLVNPKEGILRVINGTNEKRPNVILICVESLSAKFLGIFGNEDNLTPTLDSLARKETYFSNLYATGTRTVRGMEAITLSIPPTPGRSIVKRESNQGLFTIVEVFRSKGYKRTFFYGGDGYFDNMDKFFSGNGFDIVDRGRGFLTSGDIVTERKNIEDDEVTFENAWGVCDEDIFNNVLKEADEMAGKGKPFFNFIMTTSNHKPYTYPDAKIDIPSGTGRNGAVKYTDFAIGEFLRKAKNKEWYDNTVIVIMADHCASSAGRWELDVANYHIPAIIVNLEKGQGRNIARQCSQIDVFPTLFAQLGWNYNSNFFGQNVLDSIKMEPRAFIGNYRKLGLLKTDKVQILGDGKVVNQYLWDQEDNSLTNQPVDSSFLKETVSYYQTADFHYNNDGLKVKQGK